MCIRDSFSCHSLRLHLFCPPLYSLCLIPCLYIFLPCCRCSSFQPLPHFLCFFLNCFFHFFVPPWCMSLPSTSYPSLTKSFLCHFPDDILQVFIFFSISYSFLHFPFIISSRFLFCQLLHSDHCPLLLIYSSLPSYLHIRHQQSMIRIQGHSWDCLLYTSDAADERSSVDLGGRRII